MVPGGEAVGCCVTVACASLVDIETLGVLPDASTMRGPCNAAAAAFSTCNVTCTVPEVPIVCTGRLSVAERDVITPDTGTVAAVVWPATTEMLADPTLSG